MWQTARVEQSEAFARFRECVVEVNDALATIAAAEREMAHQIRVMEREGAPRSRLIAALEKLNEVRRTLGRAPSGEVPLPAAEIGRVA